MGLSSMPFWSKHEDPPYFHEMWYYYLENTKEIAYCSAIQLRRNHPMYWYITLKLASRSIMSAKKHHHFWLEDVNNTVFLLACPEKTCKAIRNSTPCFWYQEHLKLRPFCAPKLGFITSLQYDYWAYKINFVFW